MEDRQESEHPPAHLSRASSRDTGFIHSIPGVQSTHKSCSNASGHFRLISKEELMEEFLTVFDGQIRTMNDEVFKIMITEASNHSESVPLGHCPTHLWSRSKWSLSCLSRRVSSPSRLSPQIGVHPLWSHEERTLSASGSVWTFHPSTTSSDMRSSSPCPKQ